MDCLRPIIKLFKPDPDLTLDPAEGLYEQVVQRRLQRVSRSSLKRKKKTPKCPTLRDRIRKKIEEQRSTTATISAFNATSGRKRIMSNSISKKK